MMLVFGSFSFRFSSFFWCGDDVVLFSLLSFDDRVRKRNFMMIFLVESRVWGGLMILQNTVVKNVIFFKVQKVEGGFDVVEDIIYTELCQLRREKLKIILQEGLGQGFIFFFRIGKILFGLYLCAFYGLFRVVIKESLEGSSRYQRFYVVFVVGCSLATIRQKVFRFFIKETGKKRFFVIEMLF